MKKRFIALFLSLVLMVASLQIGVYAAPSNTSMSTARALGSNVGDQITVTGLTSGQSQWFSLYANAGDWIYPCAYGMQSGDDWDIGLYNSSGTQVALSAKYGTSIEYVGYTVPSGASGTYYVKVNAYSVSGTSSWCYFKVVRSCGSSEDSSVNSNYIRTDARHYMEVYWNSYNEAYDDMTDDGGDCTNYVSQILHYGGMAMRGNANSRDAITSWFMDKYLDIYNTSNYSATWSSAGYFTYHWGTNSMGTGNERAYSCKYYIGQDIVDNFSLIKTSISVGDVIQLTSNGATGRYHTLAVYSLESNDIKMSCHTPNTKTRSLLTEAQSNPTMMFVIIRVKAGS